MAFTKIWTVPVAARQDPSAPITTGWGNDTWDNLQHLLEWLGADYTAGAAPNHNHDGVNSAKVNIFPGIMPNGSFEELSGGLPIGWTATENTGGTVATTTTQNAHGDTAVAITSTVLANGGGSLIQDEYKPVTAGREYPFEIYRFASVAGVSCAVQIEWYDKDLALISTSAVFSDASTPTSWTLYSGVVTAPGIAASPSSARYARVKLFGGVPATGTAVGTVFFDGGIAHEPLVDSAIKEQHLNPLSAGASVGLRLAANYSQYTTAYISAHIFDVHRHGTITVKWSAKISGAGGQVSSSYVDKSGVTQGSVHTTSSTSYVEFSETFSVNIGDRITLYHKHSNTSLGDTSEVYDVYCLVDNSLAIVAIKGLA